MAFRKFPKDELGQGLRPFFRSVREGSDLDVRTPFWEGAPLQDIIEKWDFEFKNHIVNVPSADSTRLFEIEREQRLKIGPLSIRLPLSERMPSIASYFRRDWPDVDLTRERELFNAKVRSKGVSLSAVHSRDALKHNTNSGLPWFTRRNRVLEEALELAIQDDWEMIPAVLGWRGSSSGFVESAGGSSFDFQDPKQRDLWMFSFVTNIVENQIFSVWQKMFRGSNFLKAWQTPEVVDQAVFSLIDNAQEWGVPIISTDFSTFDQTIGPSMMEQVSLCWKSAFQSAEHELIGRIFKNVTNVPLMVQLDQVLEGAHGMPSGTVVTNGGDSTAHRLAQLRVGELLHAQLSMWCQIQGDDGLLVAQGIRNVDDVLEVYSQLGFESNPDKQFVGDRDCIYLQRYYHPAFPAGGIYPTYRALNSLMSMERFHDSEQWGADLAILRAIMILENLKHHPLFVQFVKFVQLGDSYRLGATWPGGFTALLSPSVLKKASGVRGFIPSYNQERRLGGIHEFEVVKLLKELP